MTVSCITMFVETDECVLMTRIRMEFLMKLLCWVFVGGYQVPGVSLPNQSVAAAWQ